MDTQKTVLKSWKAEWKATAKALGYSSIYTQLLYSWRDDAIAGGGTVERTANRKLFRDSIDHWHPSNIEVITGRRPSRYGMHFPAGGWATTFSVSTDIVWPADIQEEVNVDEDWEPNRLADDEFVALMDRAAARFEISEQGLKPETMEVLARLSEACPAPVVLRPDSPWGADTTFHLWCVVTATEPNGPYMAMRQEMQPILETLMDGVKELRRTRLGLS